MLVFLPGSVHEYNIHIAGKINNLKYLFRDSVGTKTRIFRTYVCGSVVVGEAIRGIVGMWVRAAAQLCVGVKVDRRGCVRLQERDELASSWRTLLVLGGCALHCSM